MARQLSLLGGFELRCAGQEVAVSRNGQRLLALLALQARPLERLWVAGTLWIDAAEEGAGASLRSALWRLPQPGGAAVVEASTTHLRLAGEVKRLECSAGPSDRDLDRSSLGRDLLPDWYEDWVVLERERFRQLRLHAGGLCRRLTEAGRFGAAVQAGLAAVAGEPLRESAHRTLIRAHLAEGTPGEAVRQYHTYRRLLAGEPAIEPSAAIRGWSSRCCGDAAVTLAGHRPGPCDRSQTVPFPSGAASSSSGSGSSRSRPAGSGPA